jgi:hypothetical protein
MSSIVVGLILFSLAWLSLFGLLGWRFQHNDAWEFADVLYYPLSVAGLILLALSYERTREITRLNQQEAEMEYRLDESRRQQPALTSTDIGSPFLRVSYDGIMQIVKLGQACEQSLSADEKCLRARDDGAKIDQILKGFQPYEGLASDLATARSIQDFCSRGYKVIEALESVGGINSIIYGELKQTFSELAKMNLTFFDWNTTEQHRNAFLVTIRAKRDGFVSAMPRDYQGTVREQWDAESSTAGLVALSFTMCQRIPSAYKQQMETFYRWESTVKDLQQKTDEQKRIIEDLRKTPPGPSSMETRVDDIKSNTWPFIIVVALGLKFGKGVSKVGPIIMIWRERRRSATRAP